MKKKLMKPTKFMRLIEGIRANDDNSFTELCDYIQALESDARELEMIKDFIQKRPQKIDTTRYE